MTCVASALPSLGSRSRRQRGAVSAVGGSGTRGDQGELLGAADREESALARRGYLVGDTGLVETTGLTSGLMSVLVLCLYVSSDAVQTLYPAPTYLWLACPVMLYWVTRIWFLARRGQLADDPVLFATSDRTSYVCGALIAALVLLSATGAA